jgi:hypothetical protein
MVTGEQHSIAIKISVFNALRAAVMAFEALRNHERTCRACVPFGPRCEEHGRLWDLATAANNEALKAVGK